MKHRRTVTTGAAFFALLILWAGANALAFVIAFTLYSFGAQRVPNLVYILPGIYVAAWATQEAR